MILVGNQRGGGKQLALHLLKEENDHVQVHEIRGFVAQDLRGALNEAYAVSRGTRCKQYLFSLSLNPPSSAVVETADFEAAIARIENELGLDGQPRAIVFHEKEGRRHAHAVWSRIKTDDMKAVQLSYTKKTLMGMARELFLEHGWTMPRGLVQSDAGDPRNFSLAEWQQAKRQGKDPRAIKAALQDAWAISDAKTSFIHALEERGYRLAKGDRRSFVALDMHGEVCALPKWIGVRTKAVRQRLSDEDDLPDVAATKAKIAEEMQEAMQRHKGQLLSDLQPYNSQLHKQRRAMVHRHRATRQKLIETIEHRKWQEARIRQSRFRSGLKGLWDWARGETKRIQHRNEREAAACALRDREELDASIFAQLAERRRLVDMRAELAREFASRRREIRDDIRAYGQLRDHPAFADRRRPTR
ncbi:relaxase/mobilization nuclease domain-containing protein [Rhodobium gokarnense]|uniref:MobA/VirD2-like nuclease domain-containing protein n=1 Tax=Rhodobium gokarnense TaxID=364296 RepID=A0ABT3HEP3_9HYPH|nr:relaxase/mobilization nuclease domain-containing protein [Rhodobium gokarnense]MCW2308865.1 hypothetical protein [Rhodobium gokarnense]